MEVQVEKTTEASQVGQLGQTYSQAVTTLQAALPLTTDRTVVVITKMDRVGLEAFLATSSGASKLEATPAVVARVASVAVERSNDQFPPPSGVTL